MYYRCRSCQNKVSFGCLPTASFGLLFMGCTAVAGAVPWAIGEFLWPALPHWVPFAALPFLLALAFLLACVVTMVFGSIEWLLLHLRRCAVCGRRRWSWGFTEGFGL